MAAFEVQSEIVVVLCLVSYTHLVSCLITNKAMGKLNIAHHKSYHPYRRDNIEKVRRDEEEAREKEAKEDGRMMLAVCSLDSPMHYSYRPSRTQKPESTG